MTEEEKKAAEKAIEEKAKKLLDDKKAETLEDAKKMAKELIDAESKSTNEKVEKVSKSVEEVQETLKKNQEQLDKISEKLNAKNFDKEEDKSFGAVFADETEKNFEAIKNVRKGNGFSMQLKLVGTMTSANNLTGDVVRTYQQNPALVPSPLLNMRDLVPAINSATGAYVIYRETGGEGSISSQATPGDPKTQKDYDLTAVIYNATYIAGFVRIAKQMLQDLPFMQTALPQMLLRDFYKAENSIMYTALSTAATGSTTTTYTADVEQIIDWTANLEAADFSVNGIVINPKDWATILITHPTNAAYSVPGGVVINPLTGGIMIAGIPVYKASFIPKDKVLLGDWSQAKRVVVDDLKVEFFEQDSDNVQRNLVTVRVESREVLAIDRPDAFVFGDLGNES
jgi:HK97 family phage major capsid protein